MELPKEGDYVTPATPPPIGKVVRVWKILGQYLVEWPNGRRAIVTQPAKLKVVCDHDRYCGGCHHCTHPGCPHSHIEGH